MGEPCGLGPMAPMAQATSAIASSGFGASHGHLREKPQGNSVQIQSLPVPDRLQWNV